MSPSEKAEPTDDGLKAVWKIQDSRTRQAITVVPPARPDAGPIAARMAFWAPVGLFFFFTVLFTIMLLKKVPLHPMHYLLVSAAFFAFHILLAYLVDHIDIHRAFWISAAVSVLLVVSYMRLVAGARFAVLYAGLAQLVYLVGFSYAFFFVGYTGLSIVIVAILTLLVIMMATGRVDWNTVFKKGASAPPSPPPQAR
jgi:inner membrane protein involved in colicin E2 resistance